MKKRRSGLSLIEVLFTMVLVIIVVTISAPVFRSFYRTFDIVRTRYRLATQSYSALKHIHELGKTSFFFDETDPVNKRYTFYQYIDYSTPPAYADFYNDTTNTVPVNKRIIRSIEYNAAAEEIRYYDDYENNPDEFRVLAGNVSDFDMEEVQLDSLPWGGNEEPHNRVALEFTITYEVRMPDGGDIIIESDFETEFSLRCRYAMTAPRPAPPTP